MQQTGTGRCMQQQRLSRGLTLRQLAEQCVKAGTPVTYSALAKIESGKSTPRPTLRATLAKLLELDVADFQKAAS